MVQIEHSRQLKHCEINTLVYFLSDGQSFTVNKVLVEKRELNPGEQFSDGGKNLFLLCIRYHSHLYNILCNVLQKGTRIFVIESFCGKIHIL